MSDTAPVVIYGDEYCAYCAAARMLFTRKGVPFEDELQFAGGKIRICYFADPAGNRGQVVYRSEPL